jgi:hypothetical protein
VEEEMEEEEEEEEEENSKHTAINMVSHNLFLNLQR